MPYTAKKQTQAELDYRRIEAAIRYLDARHRSQPSLAEVAAHVHLSPSHFDRLFARWAGVSPKKYLQHLTREHARALLRNSASVLDTAHESGLSGPGRLHDLLVTCDGMTPGQLKQRGRDVTITWGIHDSPFGRCLLGVTEKGICSLQFVDDEPEGSFANRILEDWPCADLHWDDRATRPVVERVFRRPVRGRAPELRLFLRGTTFQLAVWRALLKIPAGSVTTYKAIAKSIRQAGASRAVGGAVGGNPVAWLIPCHRVLRGSGEISGYRWGPERKVAMLFREFVQKQNGSL